MALPLRPNACVFLLNAKGALLVARDQNVDSFWRLPQGGIEDEKEEEAIVRELQEELGVKRGSISVHKKLSHVCEYEFETPHPGVSDKFRGQQQSFWIAIFAGKDKEITLKSTTAKREFTHWKWIELHELESLAEPKRFKRYEPALREVMEEVRALLTAGLKASGGF